jgi:hypothetical protein
VAIAVAAKPLSAIVCVPAASTTVSVAVLLPMVVGANVTLMVHFPVAPAASEAGRTPQVLVCANSVAFAPLIAMLVTESANGPVLVSVATCAALTVARGCAGNASGVVGVNVADGPCPVPLIAAVIGPAEVAAVSIAADAPATVGLNTTLIAQLAAAASVAGLTGQVFVCV